MPYRTSHAPLENESDGKPLQRWSHHLTIANAIAAASLVVTLLIVALAYVRVQLDRSKQTTCMPYVELIKVSESRRECEFGSIRTEQIGSPEDPILIVHCECSIIDAGNR